MIQAVLQIDLWSNEYFVHKNSVLTYPLKLIYMQKLFDSLKGYLEFVFFSFSWFQAKNNWKTFEMNRKILKMAPESVWTSFRVLPAPKSWSKNKTIYTFLQSSFLFIFQLNDLNPVSIATFGVFFHICQVTKSLHTSTFT